jgi:hypothetical protein
MQKVNNTMHTKVNLILIIQHPSKGNIGGMKSSAGKHTGNTLTVNDGKSSIKGA